jgi:hypothetical protein
MELFQICTNRLVNCYEWIRLRCKWTPSYEPTLAVNPRGCATACRRGVNDAVLALPSRALGEREACDLGALVWMLLRRSCPPTLWALLPDDEQDHVVVRYAAGLHAAAILGVTTAETGIADGPRSTSGLSPPPSRHWTWASHDPSALRACVVVPLVESDALIAVLALYSKTVNGFTEDHLRLLEVLGPRLAGALVDAAIADEDNRLFQPRGPRQLKLVQSS